jgi:ribonuclease P protein component
MLPKENRLKKKKDFENIFKNGKTFRSKNITVKYLFNEIEDNKIGFVVSKKFSKKATERNKVKRRLREIVRKNKKQIKKGVDIILIALPSLKGLTFEEIEKEIKNILEIIK